MVISLYICEIPRNIDKGDLEDLFKSMDGYLDARIKPTNDMRKIAFVDFKEEQQATFAKETLQGFKFSPDDKGLIIKVSDNSKGTSSNPRQGQGERRMLHRKQSRDRSEERDRTRSNRRNYSDRNYKYSPSSRSSSRRSEENNKNNFNNNKNRTENILPASSNQTNLIDLISLLSNNQNNPNQSNKPYTLSEPTQNEPNALGNILEALQGLQTVQMLSSLTGQPNPTPNQPIQNSSNQFYNSLSKYDDYFKSSIDYRKNATSIVYVEGLPNDCTDREVAHLFRPFVGFKSVRLITREKNGQKSLICFADFETVNQSTICINTLQGYRFDKNDLVGLHFSYGVSKQKEYRK